MCRLHWRDVKPFNVGLYNISTGDTIGIWQVTAFDLHEKKAITLFRVEQLSEQDLVQIRDLLANRADIHIKSAFIYNEAMSIWDLQFRLKSPILTKLQTLECVRVGTHENQIFAVDNSSSGLRNTEYSVGAFLYCFGKVVNRCDESSKSWRKCLLDTFSVREPQVHLKTVLGSYVCDSGDSPDNKKQRVSTLSIVDIFKITDVSLKLSTNTIIQVRIYTAPFHILWVHEECKWNGYLAEFFRALHSKIYTGFNGMRPLFCYIFPPAVDGPTTFPPVFTSFPFLCMRYGKPKKIIQEAIKSDNFSIFSKLPSLSKSEFADILLGVKRGPCIELMTMWPLFTKELNNGIVDQNKIIISESMTVMEIDFCKSFSSVYDIDLSPARLDTFQEIIDVLSVSARDSMISKYNEFLFAIISSGHSHGFTWAAIHNCTVYMISRCYMTTQQISCFKHEIFTRVGPVIGHVDSFLPDISVLTNTTGQLMNLDGSIVFMRPRCLAQMSIPAAFHEALVHAIEYTMCPCEHSRTHIFEKLCIQLLQQRRNCAFWVMSTTDIDQVTVRPCGLFYCIAPAYYIQTKEGRAFWLPTHCIPSQFNYESYLEDLADVLEIDKEDRRPLIKKCQSLLNIL